MSTKQLSVFLRLRLVPVVLILALIGAGLVPLIAAPTAQADTFFGGTWMTPTQVDVTDCYDAYGDLLSPNCQQSYTHVTSTYNYSSDSFGTMTLTSSDRTNCDGTPAFITIGPSYTTALSLVVHVVPENQGTKTCDPPTTYVMSLSNTFNSLLTGLARWTDQTHVSFGGNTFAAGSPNGDQITLTETKITNCKGSPDTITVGDNNLGLDYQTAISATLSTYIIPTSGPCRSAIDYIGISSFSNLFVFYGTWTDSKTIALSTYTGDHTPADVQAAGTYAQSSVSGSKMVLQHQLATGLNDCLATAGNGQQTLFFDSITVDPYSTARTATLTLYTQTPSATTGIPCQASTHSVRLTDSSNNPTGQPPTSTPTLGGCIFTANGLNFFLCPVYDFVLSGVQTLNSAIQSVLYVDTGQIFSPTFQTAFDALRNISLTIIILAGLVMVVSQAAGLEVFSAYTVRKSLPKIVFAAIGLSLAWPLLELVVTFFNDLGTWTQAIILTAAAPLPQSADGGVAPTLITDLGSSIAIIGLGTAGIFSLGLTVLVSLLVGFATLVIRQIIVVLCILLAPLAIALSILPGTANLWKLWRTTLVGALAMFPIIMGFLASGDVVARIAILQAQNAGATGWLYITIALVGKFVPFLFIGTAIGLANSTIGGINNTINGRLLKSFYEGQSKKRQAIQAENWAKFKAGSRYNPESFSVPIGNRRIGPGNLVNWVGGHIGAGIHGPRGILGFGSTGEAVRAANAGLSADAAGKVNPLFPSVTSDWHAALALAGGNDAGFLRGFAGGVGTSGLPAARSIQANQQMQVAAFEALGKSGGFTGSTTDVFNLADRISKGNTALRTNMLQTYMANSRAGGRADQGRFAIEDTRDPVTGRITRHGGDLDLNRALGEMQISDIARQKPESLNTLFTNTNVETAITSLRAAGNIGGAQHIADLVYSASRREDVPPQLSQRLQALTRYAPIAAEMRTAEQNFNANRRGT